jgi:hypothetical protein
MSTLKGKHGPKLSSSGAILYLHQVQKNEKPENGWKQPPLPGLFIKTKGYVEKYVPTITFIEYGK